MLALWLLACVGGRSTPATPPPDPAPVEAEASDAPPAASHGVMRFETIVSPAGADRLTAPVSTKKVHVDGREVAIDYTVLRRTGDDGFGTVLDEHGEPLEALCNEQDFNALLEVGGTPYLVSHLECTPGGMTVTELAQSSEGALSVVASRPVDWAPVGGLWNPCAGQVTPWNTHLASEEYEPDGRRVPTPKDGWPYKAWSRMEAYQDAPLVPWRFGWTPEVRIADDGAVSVTKYLSPGRFSHEIAYVLPDRRTVYLSDDGYAVGWFLFVADAPGDLSAGTLYAAKLSVADRTGGGVMPIQWVSLGHATDGQIQPLIDANVPFSALFDAQDPGPGDTCPETHRFVRHAYGEECLALAEPSEAVADPALAASRLETRRYAAWLGATTELVKGEGVAYDPIEGQVFVALSSIKATMTDGKGHVDLDPEPCGGVYGGKVAAGQADADGAAIPSDFVMTELRPVVMGRSEGKRCADDGIANPDNITYLPGYGKLVIAEDTAKHDNAYLWSYDMHRGELERLMVAPPFGELTGVHWIPDIGGFGYLTVAVQHPWSEGIDGGLPDGITEADTRTFTGVLGPFPSLTAGMQAQ